MTSETEILHSLLLSRMPGLTQPQARALLRYYGSAEAAFADSAPASARWAKVRAEAGPLDELRSRLQREMAFCAGHHVRILPFSSDDYPFLLKQDEVKDAPLNLFYRGSADLNRRRVISVVGTRRITDYGKQLCAALCDDLARLAPDVLVVSGLAYGVDIHVHRSALAGGLDTVAVLAHGLDRIYPALHRRTADEMTGQGGLLTEYFTGTVPDKGNFVRRNRIVAGMSYATLVVESADRGGALITAGLAAAAGREVLAFPGRVGDSCSVGCNRLIREKDATLVTSAADVLATLGWHTAAEKAAAEPRLLPVLTAEQQRVADALEQTDGLGLNQLSQRSGVPTAALADLLFDLEDLKVVTRLPGNRFRLNAL